MCLSEKIAVFCFCSSRIQRHGGVSEPGGPVVQRQLVQWEAGVHSDE